MDQRWRVRYINSRIRRRYIVFLNWSRKDGGESDEGDIYLFSCRKQWSEIREMRLSSHQFEVSPVLFPENAKFNEFRTAGSMAKLKWETHFPGTNNMPAPKNNTPPVSF